jgi:Ca2+/Na+ antiporter
MNQSLKGIFNYVLSIILIVVGFVFLITYLRGGKIEAQPAGMLIGSLFLIFAGVLVMPIIAEKLTKKLTKLLLVFALLAGTYLAFAVVYSVQDEIDYLAEKESYDQKAIRRLLDIREAQESLKIYSGNYTDSFDSLLEFVVSPIIPVEYRSGIFHDSIDGGSLEGYMEKGYVIKRADVDSIATMMGYSTEQFDKMISGDRTAYKVRDTTYVSFYDLNWTKKERERKKLHQVSLDSLPYNPNGDRFIMDIGSTNIGGMVAPTILVKDPVPFGRDHKYLKKDTLMFGSLTEAHTDGNWRK